MAEPPLLGSPSTGHSSTTKHPLLSLSAISSPKRRSRVQPLAELRFPLIPIAHSPSYGRQRLARALRWVTRRPGFVNVSLALFGSHPRRNQYYQSQLTLVLAIITYVDGEVGVVVSLNRGCYQETNCRPHGQDLAAKVSGCNFGTEPPLWLSGYGCTFGCSSHLAGQPRWLCLSSGCTQLVCCPDAKVGVAQFENSEAEKSMPLAKVKNQSVFSDLQSPVGLNTTLMHISTPKHAQNTVTEPLRSKPCSLLTRASL